MKKISIKSKKIKLGLLIGAISLGSIGFITPFAWFGYSVFKKYFVKNEDFSQYINQIHQSKEENQRYFLDYMNKAGRNYLIKSFELNFDVADQDQAFLIKDSKDLETFKNNVLARKNESQNILFNIKKPRLMINDRWFSSQFDQFDKIAFFQNIEKIIGNNTSAFFENNLLIIDYRKNSIFYNFFYDLNGIDTQNQIIEIDALNVVEILDTEVTQPDVLHNSSHVVNLLKIPKKHDMKDLKNVNLNHINSMDHFISYFKNKNLAKKPKIIIDKY
ncbi:hypothetical protein ACW95P_01620 [Candidatus Mycoplasma pogonae]